MSEQGPRYGGWDDAIEQKMLSRERLPYGWPRLDLQAFDLAGAGIFSESQLQKLRTVAQPNTLIEHTHEQLVLPENEPELLYGPAEPRVNPHVQRTNDALALVLGFRDGSVRHASETFVRDQVTMAIKATIHSLAAREQTRIVLQELAFPVVKVLDEFIRRLPDYSHRLEDINVVNRRIEEVTAKRLQLLRQQSLHSHFLARAEDILPRYQDAAMVDAMARFDQSQHQAPLRRILDREVAAVRALARGMRTNDVDRLQIAATVRIITAHPTTELVGDE